MMRLTEIIRRLRALIRRDRLARELDEEMRLRLELPQRRLEADGLPPDVVRSAAYRRFGNAALLREDRWTPGASGRFDSDQGFRIRDPD